MSKTQKMAYLTIDDGPNDEGFKQRVDFLHRKGIVAIWFCVGEALEKHPECAIYAIQKGHIIGNHSYDHPKFSELTLEEARAQIEVTDELVEAIYQAAGVPRPMKVFRFPYLDTGCLDHDLEGKWDNAHVKAIQSILEERGYKQPEFQNIQYDWYERAGFMQCLDVHCTYDTFDWCLQDGQEMFGYHDLPTVLGRMDEHVPEQGRGLNDQASNEIIMMHSWIPMMAFETLIETILSKGIQFAHPHAFDLDIRAIKEPDYDIVHAFQCEYLDQETFIQFKNRIATHPDLYIAAFHGNELVGICYGQPSGRAEKTVQLEGIAVNHDDTRHYLRKGIGSSIMSQFEEAVRRKGYSNIDLGCVDDAKVEAFYLKNGFKPYELVAKGPNHEEYERTAIQDYESAKIQQEELRQKHQAKEVILIFGKVVE